MKKKAVRAALLSGLVLPGLGQVYLKMYGRGAIVLLGMCLSIAYVVHDLLARGLVEQVDNLMARVLDGSVDPDTQNIETLINLGPDSLLAQVASWLIIVFWIGGMIDAYYQGRLLDQAENDKKST